jgi:predicted transcriptional regulator of viral defense system
VKYQDFKNRMGAVLFTRQDIRLRGLKVFGCQLSLWRKQGHIIKLRNGVYLFSDAADGISPEEIAVRLYAPSYISLGKALSIYGLIPEMVYGLTSVTAKTTRNFKNRYGAFSYRHLRPALFFGYKEIKTNSSSYLIAEPEKALLDLLYLNRIKNEADWGSLRLNRKAVKSLFRPKALSKYLKIFNRKYMTELCRRYLG